MVSRWLRSMCLYLITRILRSDSPPVTTQKLSSAIAHTRAAELKQEGSTFDPGAGPKPHSPKWTFGFSFTRYLAI